MTASAGSGARAAGLAGAALSGAVLSAGALAGACSPGPGWPATGEAAGVQAPTANAATSPRARNLRDFIVRCSSLSIMYLPTSMPLTAAGCPLAVRGCGVSRAITSSRCTGGRLDEGPALVALPARHLPSEDHRVRRSSGRDGGRRAREDHGSPPAGIRIRGQEMDDVGGQRLAGELGRGPQLVEGAQDGGEERRRRRR